MGHLDDLDEYEAELELRLKKEYQAVFSLFRYCVLTPDATYLCNKLESTYAPQPAYPFMRLLLEDVWVCDKNRPTLMIPKTEIFLTSGDVTIEELRTEGDEPSLTPEALAEHISDRRPCADDDEYELSRFSRALGKELAHGRARSSVRSCSRARRADGCGRPVLGCARQAL